MALTESDVAHVAMLAQLALTDEELSDLAPQLDAILDYAQSVGEVAADDVPPTSHAYPLRNVFRDDDQVADPLDAEQVIANAPEAEQNQFRVPRVLGDPA